MKKIWYYISMGLAFVVMVLKVALSREKRKAAQTEAKRSKASEKANKDATEALVRGLEKEHENTTDNPRDYKF